MHATPVSFYSVPRGRWLGFLALVVSVYGVESAGAQRRRSAIAPTAVVTALDHTKPGCAALGGLAALPAHVRVVGLGEATQGTAEFGRVKANAIDCWLRTAGVTTVAIGATASMCSTRSQIRTSSK